jgi:hypothetical protein
MTRTDGSGSEARRPKGRFDSSPARTVRAVADKQLGVEGTQRRPPEAFIAGPPPGRPVGRASVWLAGGGR